MDLVTNLLSNPAVRTGLHLASPEIALGIDALLALTQKRKPGVTDLLAIIDKQLASVLAELAKPQPFHFKRELEIRAQQLLQIVVEWDKTN